MSYVANEVHSLYLVGILVYYYASEKLAFSKNIETVSFLFLFLFLFIGKEKKQHRHQLWKFASELVGTFK